MRTLLYVNGANSITLGAVNPHNYLIEALEGLGPAKAAIQSQKAPFQDGVSYIDLLFREREIVVDGLIRCANNLAIINAFKRTMEIAFNPKNGQGTLTYYNGTASYWATAVIESLVFKNKLFTEPFQKYHLEIVCPDPFWYAITQSTKNIARGATETCVNAGDYQTPMTIVVTGPCTNPKIAIGSTYIKVTKTLAAGDTVNINTAFGLKSVTFTHLGTTTNIMNLLDAGSTFLQLLPGNNSVIYTEDGTDSGYVDLGWYSRYCGC
jgi:hypothetical protein